MSKVHLSPTLQRILLEALIIGCLAAAVGLSLNFPMVMNAFTGKTVALPKLLKSSAPGQTVVTSPAVVAYPDPIELDEIDELLAAGAMLVDARNRVDYAKSHLATAVSLPLGEQAEQLAKFIATVPKDRVLIVYCNGFGCPDSFDLGVILLSEGFTEVRVFEGGYPQWRDAGRPLETGAE
jgi:rhodanese-related sulfurtransferase